MIKILKKCSVINACSKLGSSTMVHQEQKEEKKNIDVNTTTSLEAFQSLQNKGENLKPNNTYKA
jgi:hypothetical protein